MNQHRALSFEASLQALAKSNSGLAFRRVPSSFTSYFGESLDWPDWLLEGTDFTGRQDIPREVVLIDSLKPVAKLLTRFGEVRLAEMMLEWPRFPLEAEALAAPDLETALRNLIVRVDQKNPTVNLKIAEEDDALVIRIGITPELGAFRAFYEQMVLTWLFLIVRSFLGMSKARRNLLAQVAIGRVHSDPAINALLPCRGIDVIGAARFVIPPEALRCPGPDFKAELWTSVLSALETLAAPDAAQGSTIGESIGDLIARSLRANRKVPLLVEISRSIGRSPRSLTRTLTEEGTTYREIVDHARIGLAKGLLVDGNASIREISARLGYSDDTAFVRAFRRRCGISPARWRNAATR
ncbi:MAG: helix-turn-helix domain-containing protein [Erythrobacter sp.]